MKAKTMLQKVVSVTLTVVMLLCSLSLTTVSAVETVTIAGNFGDVNVPGVTYTVSLNGVTVDAATYSIKWYTSPTGNEGDFTQISGKNSHNIFWQSPGIM